MNREKGFTLMEIVGLISILSVIVSLLMIKIGEVQKKSFDSKVKTQLVSIRNTAALYYSNHSNYGIPTYWQKDGSGTNGCQDGMFSSGETEMPKLTVTPGYPNNPNTMVCNTDSIKYAVSDKLSSPRTYWCVDSTGVSKEESAPLDKDVQCP